MQISTRSDGTLGEVDPSSTLNSILDMISGKQSTQTASPSTEVTKGNLTTDQMTQLVQQVLGQSGGLASVAQGQHTAGIYNSTVNQQMINDLLARVGTNVAAANAGKTTTNSGKTITEGTPSLAQRASSPTFAGSLGTMIVGKLASPLIKKGQQAIADTAGSVYDTIMTPSAETSNAAAGIGGVEDYGYGGALDVATSAADSASAVDAATSAGDAATNLPTDYSQDESWLNFSDGTSSSAADVSNVSSGADAASGATDTTSSSIPYASIASLVPEAAKTIEGKSNIGNFMRRGGSRAALSYATYGISSLLDVALQGSVSQMARDVTDTTSDYLSYGAVDSLHGAMDSSIDLSHDLPNMGPEITQGIGGGISDMSKSIGGAASDIWQNVTSAFGL